MYIADLLNSRNLFQRLDNWIAGGQPTPQRKSTLVLLQRANQVLFHIDQYKAIRSIAIDQFSSHLLNEAGLPHSLHAWSPLVTGLITEVSGAFSALRIMQNDSWKLIAAISNVRNAPMSLREAYETFVRNYGHGNRRPRWLDELSPEVRGMIVNYWNQSGSRLASYRDVDQHFDLLARGAMFFPDRQGDSRLAILLPDNPDARSRAQFTYVNAQDAFETAHAGFSELHSLVDQVAERCGAPRRRLEQSWEFNPPIHHQIGISTLTAITLGDELGRSGYLISQNENTQVQIRPIHLGG